MFKKMFKFFSGSGITKSSFGLFSFKAFIFILKTLRIFGTTGDNKIFLGSLTGFTTYFTSSKGDFESEIIRSNIAEGNIVLDVGAHIGYYTLLMSRGVGDKGRVFAFEPGPDNLYDLMANIRKNNCKNVEIVEMAVSDKNTEGKFYLSGVDTSEHSLYDMGAKDYITVKTVRLDEYFKDLNKDIDFIKIDIEGSEKAALDGMMEILKQNKKIKIFTEVNKEALKRAGSSAEEYLQSLKGLGFTFYYVSATNRRLDELPIEDLHKVFRNTGFINVLCLRNNN